LRDKAAMRSLARRCRSLLCVLALPLIASATEFDLPKVQPGLRFTLPDDFIQPETKGGRGYAFQSAEKKDNGAIEVQILPGLRAAGKQLVPPVTDDTSPTLKVGQHELRWAVTKPEGDRKKFAYSAALRTSDLNIRLSTGGGAYVVFSAYADTEEEAQRLWRLFEKVNLPEKKE
jgi:hypothetical protein